jgi:pantoate kinase
MVRSRPSESFPLPSGCYTGSAGAGLKLRRRVEVLVVEMETREIGGATIRVQK